MNDQEIIALSGPALDAAIHTHVFGQTGKPPAYSSDDAVGLMLLDRMPLFVGRIDPGHPNYDPARPFVAGTLAFEQSIKGDGTRLRVTAANKLTALCKAALLVTFAPRGQRAHTARPAVNPAQELAAKVGTPAARGAAAIATAQARRKATKKEPRGKVRIGGGVASKPVATQPAQPRLGANQRSQPGIFVHARDPRPPMPPRTKEFKPGTMLPVAGNVGQGSKF